MKASLPTRPTVKSSSLTDSILKIFPRPDHTVSPWPAAEGYVRGQASFAGLAVARWLVRSDAAGDAVEMLPHEIKIRTASAIFLTS